MIPGAAVEQAHPPRSWRPAVVDIARQRGEHRRLACVRAAIDRFLVAHGKTTTGSKLLKTDAAVPVAGSPECGGRQFVVAGSNSSDQGHGTRADTVFEGPPGVSRWLPGAAQLPYIKPIGSHRDLFFDDKFVVWPPEALRPSGAAQLLVSDRIGGHGDTSDDDMVGPLEASSFPRHWCDSAERGPSEAFRSEVDVPEKHP